jgi:hypothetical protein
MAHLICHERLPEVLEQLITKLSAKSSPPSTSISCTPKCAKTGATRLCEYIKNAIIGEMKHAESLMERILFLSTGRFRT